MYDDFVKEINNLRCEKEQLNSLVNSCQEEIRQLKKQLETYEIEGYKQDEELNKISFDIRKYKIQQKEFISYLEDEIKKTINTIELLSGTGSCRIPSLQYKKLILKEILQKYKSIIEDDKQ